MSLNLFKIFASNVIERLKVLIKAQYFNKNTQRRRGAPAATPKK